MARPLARALGHVTTLTLGLAAGFWFATTPPPLVARQAPATGAAPSLTRPAGAEPEDLVYEQLARQYDQFRQVDRTFELVARAVSPAVVHIVARKNGQDEAGKPGKFEETGSGVIVRADASDTRYVLTNNHVVDGARAEDVSVNLQDGRIVKPTLFWADQTVDVAVLKLDRVDLPVARLGNSDEAIVGSWVMAIGSPFGLTHSVSQGIISARSRYEAELEEDGVENQDFLQTDAAINPGNSGGPLVNLKGEVIGLNTAIASNGGGSEGVGFSIPINLARWAMVQLVKTGRVSRGGIGVHLMELDPASASKLGLDRPRGARIDTIQDGSPADQAGLQQGDVILKFNGLEVVDYNHLINLVSMTPIGESADLTVWRNRRPLPVKVTVADRAAVVARGGPAVQQDPAVGLLRRPAPSPAPTPAPAAEPAPAPAAPPVGDLAMADIDGPGAARRFGLSDGFRGVLVTRIDATSPLAGHLRASDLIETVGGRPVRTAAEVVQALNRPNRGPVDVVVVRTERGIPQRRTLRVP